MDILKFASDSLIISNVLTNLSALPNISYIESHLVDTSNLKLTIMSIIES